MSQMKHGWIHDPQLFIYIHIIWEIPHTLDDFSQNYAFLMKKYCLGAEGILFHTSLKNRFPLHAVLASL